MLDKASQISLSNGIILTEDNKNLSQEAVLGGSLL